jgi:hypothetical protein
MKTEPASGTERAIVEKLVDSQVGLDGDGIRA